MDQKKKTCLLAALALAVFLGSIFHKNAAVAVFAETKSAFSIEAEMLPTDKKTYDVRLTVENQGEDWEGTVRLMVDENYGQPTAYDTSLSLPKGSRKQFVVKVPVGSIDSTNGTIIVTLLDRGGEEVSKSVFNRLLAEQMEALSMGILSDSYSELTYLDMGGSELYFYDNSYPVRLVELKQGDLKDTLDSLTFLVIDQYNTGILTEEELLAIEQWNMDGGVLIIGTGAYVEDTLRGFDGGYLGVGSGEIQSSGDNSIHGMDDVDWTKLTMAQIQGINSMNMDYYNGGWHQSMGQGSVCVLPYSLVEMGGADDFYLDTQQEIFVMQMLESASDYAGSRYTYNYYYDSPNYYIQRLLSVVGNSNSILNFGGLKGIVVVYVIFVGPLLYLILRFLKRRELYWVMVPVTALLGIGLVFFAGRGFEVVNTKVFSVTLKNLSDNGKSATYLHCYDANRREWSLKLADTCEYAGPMGSTSYYYSISGDKPYYYHIKKEGDVFSLGINPGSNFEDSYFYLGNTEGSDGVNGSLLTQDMAVGKNGVSGTVVNDTNRDMPYFAVIHNHNVYIFEGLLAGESCNLGSMKPIYEMSDYYYSSYLYDFMLDIYDQGEYDELGVLSALGVGICDVYSQSDQNDFTVIGAVENWEKKVDDNCSETSYGCLYSVQ